MDPITIGASLLTALMAASKDKAVGAASKYLEDAVKERAARMWGVLSENNEEKFARLMVDHVLAEAAAFPPDQALLVEPLSTVGDAGIWGPRGTLKINLLWVNRADFPLRIRDVKVTARVDAKEPEWVAQSGDEFVLVSRGSQRRVVEIDLATAATLPTFERNGAPCDVSVTALVCGPWDEGRAHRTRDLVEMSVWLPVIGLDVSGLITDVEDADLIIKDYLRDLVNKCEYNIQVRFAEFDRAHKLRPGLAKERFVAIARQLKHTVEAGPGVALVALYHEPSEPFSGGYVGVSGIDF